MTPPGSDVAFDRAPVALWEVDLSGSVAWMERQRAAGIVDLGAHFGENRDALVELGRRSILKRVNRAALAMAGATSAEEMCGPLDELLGYESLEMFGKMAAAIFRGAKRVDVEAPARTIDGESFEAQATLIIPDDPEDLDSVVISFVDVSRRKRSERMLMRIADGVSGVVGERFLNSMVVALVDSLGAEHAFIGEYLEDRKSVRTIAYCRAGQIGEDIEYDLGGTPCQEVLSRALCTFPSGVAELFPEDSLLQEMGAEGYAGTPLWDSRGNVIGIMALIYVEPIRDEAAVQSALAIFASRAAAELERMWVDEHRKALQARLAHADRMESVGRMAGGIAHDFNNLLTPILGISGIALNDPELPEQLREDLQQIQDAARKGAELTKQLLAIGRRQVLSLTNVNINDVVTEFVTMFRRVLSEDIQLVVERSEVPPNVMADPAQVTQILMNLAVNAQHAMPEGGRLEISVSTKRIAEGEVEGLEEGRYVSLCVADTGTGIRPDLQERLFEPFFTTKAADEGTGLGLSTVYGIATQHGGGVRFDSEVGHGTSFEVLLPLTSAVPVAAEKENGDRRTGDVSGARILVVEDDDAVRRLAVRALRASGHEVWDAGDPTQVLDMLREQSVAPDLLLTDVVMPGLTGPELHERLVAEGIRCPVLFMSGYTGEALSRYGDPPTERLLEKPFTMEELAGRVASVLREEASAAGPDD